MTQENNAKEAAREMLRGIVKEEIHKSKKPMWMIGAGVVLLTLSAAISIVVGWSLSNDLKPESQITSIATVEKHQPIERMVGITTALMVMADDQIDGREVDFAMSILARRQEAQLGARPQFVPDSSAWLNSHLSMHYFDHALAYLQTGEDKHFNALTTSSAQFIRSIDETHHLKRYASQQRAVYELVAMLQDDLDIDHAPGRSQQIKGLTNLWIEYAKNRQDIDQQGQSAIYQSRMENILSTLKENPNTLP